MGSKFKHNCAGVNMRFMSAYLILNSIKPINQTKS